tara:strand:+ start:1039 stop:1611 length:573 start_codon:yes stop_codon:yes gene_type:complete
MSRKSKSKTKSKSKAKSNRKRQIYSKKKKAGAISGRVEGKDLIAGKLYKVIINASLDEVYEPPLKILAIKGGTWTPSDGPIVYHFANIMKDENDSRWDNYNPGRMPFDEIMVSINGAKYPIKDTYFSVSESVKINGNEIQNYFEEVIPRLATLALNAYIKQKETSDILNDKDQEELSETVYRDEVRNNND